MKTDTAQTAQQLPQEHQNYIEKPEQDYQSTVFDFGDQLSSGYQPPHEMPTYTITPTNYNINAYQTSQPKIADIFTHKYENGKWYYLVRFEGCSYRSKTWIEPPQDEHSAYKIRQYLEKISKKNNNYPPQPPFYPPEYDIPQKILYHRETPKGREYLVLWKGLERKDATWETRESLDDDQLVIEYSSIPTDEEVRNHPRPLKQDFKELTISPISKSHEQLQLDKLRYLNALIQQWYYKRSSVFVSNHDVSITDMRSIMCAFMNNLFKKEHQYGPYIVIVPLKDIQEWEKQIQNWSSLKLLVLNGTQNDRDMIVKYEMFYPDKRKLRFQVLLTTADALSKTYVLTTIHWVSVIYEQDPKIKPTQQSKIYTSLQIITTEHKNVLLPQMPASVPELLNLFNFVQPGYFTNKAQFSNTYGSFNQEGQVLVLQQLLSPFITNLSQQPPEIIPLETELDEKIVECQMSKIQVDCYRSIFSKNQEILAKKGQKPLITLHNIGEDLKRICSHPFLIEKIRSSLVKDINDAEDTELSVIMKSSGKMAVLDSLLAKMRAEGVQVLLCTQTPRMLDILQKMIEYKGYRFQRVEGSLRTIPPRFDGFYVYLICTTSIQKTTDFNFSSVNNIILFESDWKPQYDLYQVTQKCQKFDKGRKIQVFRLVSSQSFERVLFDSIMQYIVANKQKTQMSCLDTDPFLNDTKMLEQMLKISAIYAFSDSFPILSDDLIQHTENVNIDAILHNAIEYVYPSKSNVFDQTSFIPKSNFKAPVVPQKVDEPHFWKTVIPQNYHERELQDIYNMQSPISPQLPSPPTLPQSPITPQQPPLQPLQPPLQQVPPLQPLQQKSPAISSMQISPEQSAMSPLSPSDSPANALRKAILLWNRKQSTDFVIFMTKFGFSRLNEFHPYGTDLEEKYFPELGRLFIRWLFSAASMDKAQFPLITQVVNSPMSAFEEQFSNLRKDQLFSAVTQNAKAKLSKIHIAEFLHLIVSSAKTEDAIPVPDIQGGLEVASWVSPRDDKMLMKMTWEKGLGEVTNEMIFQTKKLNNTLPAEQDDMMILPFTPFDRIKNIINAFVKLFISYSKRTKQKQIPINHETCSIVVQQISKADHNQIIHAIENYDITNIDLFVKQVGLKKSDEAVRQYIDNLLSECKTIIDPTQQILKGAGSKNKGILAANISSAVAQRVMKQYEMFEKLHGLLENGQVSDVNKDAIRVLCEVGYSEAITRPEVKKMLNNEDPQIKTFQQALKKLLVSDQSQKKTYLNASQEKNTQKLKEKAAATAQTDSIQTSKNLTQNSNTSNVVQSQTPTTTPSAQSNETDADEPMPELPLHISQSLVLVSLGHVVWDREAFHTERYAYCPGYLSEKLFTSYLNPKERVWYQSMIIDGGNAPIFRVGMKDHPEAYFEGSTPSNPWLSCMKEVEKRKKELGIPTARNVSCSGPEFYGLAVPQISKLIMHMKDIEKCRKLKRSENGDGERIKSRRQVKDHQQIEIRLTQKQKQLKSQMELTSDESDVELSASYETMTETDSSSFDDDNNPEEESESQPAAKPQNDIDLQPREMTSSPLGYSENYEDDSESSDRERDSFMCKPQSEYPVQALTLKFDFKKLLENPPKPEIFIFMPNKTPQQIYSALEG